MNQVNGEQVRIETRMKELEGIAAKGNEAIKVLQDEIAERQRRISEIRTDLVRMQGAYAELGNQLKAIAPTEKAIETNDGKKK